MEILGAIEITSPPLGEAPEDIRAVWVGLILPCIKTPYEPQRYHGVLSEQPIRPTEGQKHAYSVDWVIAMTILGVKSPETRDWWLENVRPLTLVFDEGCARFEALPQP